MNKFIAISLPVLWLLYCFFYDYEYALVLRSLVGLNTGYAFAYMWKYHELKNELMKIKANEYYQKEEMRKFTEGFSYKPKINDTNK